MAGYIDTISRIYLFNYVWLNILVFLDGYEKNRFIYLCMAEYPSIYIDNYNQNRWLNILVYT